MSFIFPNQMSFSGHQTFPLRHNWLTKAADMLQENPEGLMDSELCMQEMGVGSNMVESIKHWAESSQLFKRKINAGIHTHSITREGKYLFKNENRDRYIENLDTIWLLHYLIASNPKKNAMWFYAFNVFTGRSFSKESFIHKFKFWLNENNYKIPPEGTLNRDFLCLSNMYSRFKIAVDDEYENTLTCPFKDLRIINYDKLSKHYSLRSIKTKEFSVHLFAFCLLRFISKEDNAITINSLLNDPLSPGQIFRFTEDCLLDYLIDFIAIHKGVFEFDDTIGNKQLLIKKQIDLDTTSFEHFKKVSDK